MSEVSNEKIFDRAVDLIVHGDQMLQNWTSRYITIQGALAFAVATLIKWWVDTPGLQEDNYFILFHFAMMFLTILGIGSAWLVTKLVETELDWQKNYLAATRRAEGDSPLLYSFEAQSGSSRTLSFFCFAKWLLTVIWIIILLSFIFIL